MPSASGRKTMVINPRERGVSSDINRLQKFDANDLATAFSYLFDYAGADVANSGGVGTVGATTGTPLRAEILGGLCVRPQIASVNTLVDAGVMVAVVTPTDADNSPYQVVNDPGVTNGALLTLPGNATGLTRIYVVECSVVDTVLESDNRDIFDPGTGLFAPALVQKVIAARLSYRIRTMTLAGGVTFSAGWLPLVVALAPNGTATWDDVVYMWDVRPLVSDRATTPLAAMTTTVSRILRTETSLISGTLHLRGRIDAIGPSGRRLGGDLAYSPADTFLDLGSGELQPAGFATPADTPYYLWLAEPYGLPRWCRYTSVAAGFRLPGRLRGMPVLTNGAVGPAPVYNQNLLGITTPATFGFPGFLAAAGQAVGVWAGMADTGAGMITRGFDGGNAGFTQLGSGGVFVAAAKTNVTATWNVTTGAGVPNNARELWFGAHIEYLAGVAATPATPFKVEYDDGTGVLIGTAELGTNYVAVADPLVFDVYFKVPVPANYPTGTPVTLKIVITHNGVAFGYGTPPDFATMTLHGWSLV